MSFIDKAKESIARNFKKARALFRDGDAEAVETLLFEYEDVRLLPTQGILKDMGYRVGKNGRLPSERREILRRTFRVQLVSTSEPASDYIAEWVADAVKLGSRRWTGCWAGWRRMRREKQSWTCRRPSTTGEKTRNG